MEYHFVKLILFLALKNVNAHDLPNLEELRDSVSREEQRAFIKIWLKSYDPEDARQSSEWLLPGQKP